MFELNPLAQPDAWWQHICMLLGAGIIGYIIGYRTSKDQAKNLENELNSITSDLNDCLKSGSSTSTTHDSKESALRLTAEPVVADTEKVLPDDLKLVEGIGPKIEEILNEEGILTFMQLSQANPEDIVQMLRKRGPRFQMHDPATWPRQAGLAAAGKWDDLKIWQAELNKGRTS
ncbi:hypothetical protein [Arundinibacter roseus]|uniref:DUF4332 domain-containing protein n=1 Tax=Arundinibacter roseus TaxID=2070510 RepID=A0A4R4KNR0_9BACT|nr:hypothetical protein [Arundinibacter roseus]TDB68211.1 hypothetical protein EZE20_04630 [Arundinibacter roseus]